MDENIPVTEKTVLKLNIEFEPETGAIRIGGNLDNTDLILKILFEVGHLVMQRNVEKLKKISSEATRIANAAKLNGVHEIPTAPAAN